MSKESLKKPLQILDSYFNYLLIPIILIYLLRAFKYLKSPFYSPDANNFYLPYAKKLLEVGPTLIFEKASLVMSPGTYIWPAIFGANDPIIRYANLLFGLLMLLLMFDIGRLLHSKYTGILSSFLFAMSPIIIFWIPNLLSEPPFIFFTLLFIWSLIKVAKEILWALPVCAFALTCSIFIRPVWLYPSIVFLPIFISSFIFFKQPKERKVITKLILTLILGLTLPLAFIINNQLKHNLPSIAVGSGNALFYGTNLFTGGYEPPIIDLNYAVGRFTSPDIEKLNFIEYDKLLVSVSKEHLKQMPINDLLRWIVTKFSWFNFLTPLETNSKMALIRGLEFSLSLLGFLWAIKEKKYYIVVLGFAFILQAGQAIPALYNVRYSAGNLEPLLILLAPMGLVALQTALSKNNIFLLLSYSILSFTILLLALFAHYTLLPKINFPQNMLYKVLYENSIPNSMITNLISYNLPKLTPVSPSNTFIKIELGVPNQDLHDCAPLTASLESTDNPGVNNVIKFNLRNIQENTIYLGGISSNANLIPNSPSTLTIKSNCSDVSQLKIKKISYVEASLEKYWLPKK